eukprot:g9228.t1.1.5e17418a g9228  g9228.t1 contig36:153927-155216(+)
MMLKALLVRCANKRFSSTKTSTTANLNSFVTETADYHSIMCPDPNDQPKDKTSALKGAVGVLSITTIGLLISTIVLATNNSGDAHATVAADTSFLESKALSNIVAVEEDNVCDGAKLAFDNQLCVDLSVPQAGGNITEGYVGELDVGDLVPSTKPFFLSSMCPVNVHWHVGTEHYSYGQFDENGDGPNGNIDRPSWAARYLTDASAEEEQPGFRCHHYDASDSKFTTEYDWMHCHSMEVGETYEVHWPHSAVGACGTVDQYQTPLLRRCLLQPFS